MDSMELDKYIDQARDRARRLNAALYRSARIMAWSFRRPQKDGFSKYASYPEDAQEWKKMIRLIRQRHKLPHGVTLLLGDSVCGDFEDGDKLWYAPDSSHELNHRIEQVAAGTMSPDDFDVMHFEYEEIHQFDWLWVFTGTPAYYYQHDRSPEWFDFNKAVRALKLRATKNHVPASTERKNTKQHQRRSLYLMKCERSNHYKIGISKNPRTREKTLQAEQPHITLVGSWAGLARMEKDWHSYFAEQRLRGEWFSLAPAQVRFFCHACTRGEGPPVMATA